MRLAILAASLMAGVAFGQTQETKPLKVGDPAPDFSLTNHEGKAVKLSEFRGQKWVVVAFYPKSHTPG